MMSGKIKYGEKTKKQKTKTPKPQNKNTKK